MNDGRALISIVTSIGAFSVSGLSIYLGYALFIAGATGTFKLSANTAGGSVGFESVAPGLAFALFGACVAFLALWKIFWGVVLTSITAARAT